MLICCNRRFRGGISRVLSNTQDFYRRIEFGICPNCGFYRFMDVRMKQGKVNIKTLSGKAAEEKFEQISKKYKEMKHGSKSNQNYHFGDFKLSRKKDENGNPIYLQLRKNFNDEAEIIGEIQTRVSKIAWD